MRYLLQESSISALGRVRGKFMSSEEFDAYRKWLGIKPADQPPNHYRLLGIDLFEDDDDAIDAAANQRMSYVQTRASGQHAAHGQKILNEISQARLCLLNPKKKAAYDAELKSRVEPVAEELAPPLAVSVAGPLTLDEPSDSASVPTPPVPPPLPTATPVAPLVASLPPVPPPPPFSESAFDAPPAPSKPFMEIDFQTVLQT
ncbi:MAG: hypothetical protein N2C14_06775, partial [Planctomycetales bacterium]